MNKIQRWLTPLLLAFFIRIDMQTVPAWNGWDASKVYFDADRKVYVDTYKIPIDNWVIETRDGAVRENIIRRHESPRTIPAKTQVTFSFRKDFLYERSEQLVCAAAAARPTVRRRFILINVEDLINRNVSEENTQYRIWPHLGLIYIGTAAYNQGWNVTIWDELVKGYAPIETLVKEGDIVGLSCVVSGIERSLILAKEAKLCGASYIIAGNDSAIFRANHILALPDKPIDVVFTTNSVTAVSAFFRDVPKMPPEEMKIPGMQTEPQLAAASNESSVLVQELNERSNQRSLGRFHNDDVFIVPKLDLYPHWNEVWANYRKTFGHKHSNPATVKNAIGHLAQGCTRTQGKEACLECTIFGVADVRIPSRSMLEKILLSYSDFGIDMLYNTTDSIYEMRPAVKQLRELGARWKSLTIYARAQGIAKNPELIHLWQEIATERLLLNVGMESGDERILTQGIVKSSSKNGSRLGENMQALEHIRAAGAHLHYSLIFGTPGEDIESCENSIRFLEHSCQVLGPQLDICETDFFWLNFGSPAGQVFHDYSFAQKLASLAGKNISKQEWYENFAVQADNLVVPDCAESAWYQFFTNIDMATAKVYNDRCSQIMAKHNGSIRGRAFKPI